MPQRALVNWTRTEERRGMDVPAIAYGQDGTRKAVVLSDLSYEGCRLSTPDEFSIGERVTLVIFELGAEIEATIRWAAPGKLGVRFSDHAAT